MDVCRAMAQRGEPEDIVVVADAQTAGRGRAGRVWFSPPGQALYLSILLRPKLAPRHMTWLMMMGALAVIDALQNSASRMESPVTWHHAALAIEWPNDVLLGGKKLAGVLVETSLTGETLDYAILGIGLNINTRFDDAPPEVRERATSLRTVTGSDSADLDRDVMMGALLVAFETRYAQLPSSPVADYVRHLDTLGKRVRLSAGDDVIEGVATRVDEDGALVVLTITGERVVRFGDVVDSQRAS